MLMLSGVPTPQASAQIGGKIWREFVWLLRHDELGSHRILPYQESLRPTIAGFLRVMKEKANWAEWDATPEIRTVGDDINCLVPLTFDSSTTTYCFTFRTVNDTWYLRNLLSLTLRLDTLSIVPASTFPDVSDAQRAWYREESTWLRQAKLFGVLSQHMGKDSALEQFKDGADYLVAAQMRVPLVTLSKGFILYLCWEQAVVRGSEVVLETLDDSEAVVQIKPLALILYARNGLLSKQISMEDFRAIFETIWEDRARAAGWQLHITYHEEGCTMKFERRGE